MSSKCSPSDEAISAAEKRTSNRSLIMEDMETTLAAWLREQIEEDVALSRVMICEKARRIFDDLKGKDDNEKAFNASLRWLYSFKARHGFKGTKRKVEPTHTWVWDEVYRKKSHMKFSFVQQSKEQETQCDKETVTLTRELEVEDGEKKNTEDAYLIRLEDEKPKEVVDLVSEDEEGISELIKCEDDELIPEDFLEIEMRDEQDNDRVPQVIEPPRYLKVKHFARAVEHTSTAMDGSNEVSDPNSVVVLQETQANRKGKSRLRSVTFSRKNAIHNIPTCSSLPLFRSELNNRGFI